MALRLEVTEVTPCASARSLISNDLGKLGPNIFIISKQSGMQCHFNHPSHPNRCRDMK